MATTTVDREVEKALRTVERRASKLKAVRERVREARDEADADILAARQAGATYRQIATAAGVSTAWVQTSLERAGYQTTPR